MSLPDCVSKNQELSPEQSSQLKVGLTVIEVPEFGHKVIDVLTEYGPEITNYRVALGDVPGFLYAPRLSDPATFEEIGENLFSCLSGVIGYKRRTGRGEIIEGAGLIVYPENHSGYAVHSDIFYGDTLVRLTLGLAGIGNFWSATTGEMQLKPQDVIVQNLCKGVSHGINTIGHGQRVSAFWDIPANSNRS